MRKELNRACFVAMWVCAGLVACEEDVAPTGGGVTAGGTKNPGAPSEMDAGPVPTTPDGGTIGAQDFALDIANATLVQPGSVDLKVKILRGANFKEGVSLTLSGLPADVGATSATIDVAAGNDTGVFKLTAGAASGHGTSTLKVDAKSVDGKLSKSTEVQLLVRGAPGTLDKTFGTNGTVLGALNGVYPTGLGIDTAGKIYVAAGRTPTDRSHIHRFTADGATDSGYATNGIAALPSYGHVGAFDTDGTYYLCTAPIMGIVTVWRVNPIGAKDPTWEISAYPHSVDIPNFVRDSVAYSTCNGIFPYAGGVGVSINAYNRSYQLPTASTPGPVPDSAVLFHNAKTTAASLPAARIDPALAISMDAAGNYYYASYAEPTIQLTKFDSNRVEVGRFFSRTLDKATPLEMSISPSGRVAVFNRASTISNTMYVMKPNFSAADTGYPHYIPSDVERAVTFDSKDRLIFFGRSSGQNFIVREDTSGAEDSTFARANIPGDAGLRFVRAVSDDKILFVVPSGSGTVMVGRLWN